MKHLRNSLFIVENEISKAKDMHEDVRNLISIALPVIGGPERSALLAASKFMDVADSSLNRAAEELGDAIRDMDS